MLSKISQAQKEKYKYPYYLTYMRVVKMLNSIAAKKMLNS
jgi:hypothetical protein